MEGEGNKTLAVPPSQPASSWEGKLPKYQVSSPSRKFEFVPATPERGSQRYKSKTVKRRFGPTDIAPGQLQFLSPLPLPGCWTRHVHPEGNVFYYHEELRVFTENDVTRCQTDIFFCATKLIQEAIRTEGVTMDELTEFVLNLDDKHCHYYFVDHTHRLLFWVHSVKPREGLGINLQSIIGYNHLKYLIEARYCMSYNVKPRSHCEYYPHNRTLPGEVLTRLRGMLNFAKTDVMTAHSSTSPFAQAELVAILDLVNSLKDDKKVPDQYNVWVIARLMALFTEDQFVNFYGQPCARLNADTPLFERRTWNRSTSFRMANLFLFGSPNEHALRLQRIWVDGIIIQPRWNDFISRLTAEFSRYTLFSTVMLAVNFSFLAVPGVVTPGVPASPIQIIIYCSVVSTVGSIVFSLALLNVYSDPGLLNAGPAARAMQVLSQRTWGMGRFAVIHSLPISCLIWSITLFSTALAVQVFRATQPATYVTLGVECLILVLFGLMNMTIIGLFSDGHSQDVEVPAEHDEAERGHGRFSIPLGPLARFKASR